MTDDKEDYSPGTFGCHEALDRCSLLIQLVGDLGAHPAICLNPDWEAKVVQAESILADLYQEIGRVHLANDCELSQRQTIRRRRCECW